VNRAILATGGDFNIGITDRKQLEKFIADKRKTGVYLSIFGVGEGNLNDALIQRLAQRVTATPRTSIRRSRRARP
jgi:Ca-activated chloride channel family protein